MPTINYIPKEFGLDNNTLKPGEEILYSTWTITLLPSGDVVRYVERDEVNKLSKLFTDVFILGNTYSVKMSLVTTHGPTIDAEPFIFTVTDNKDIIDLYPMPAVVDTPVVTMPYNANNIPNTNIVFNVSDMVVTGNAVLESVDWILVGDDNKVVFKSLKDEVNLKSITLKNMILDSNKAYTMYCIQKANNRDSSGAGGVTFRCASLTELDIEGDLRDSFYTLPLETNLKNPLPNLVKFDFELYGEDQVLLYTGTNNNGKIIIPTNKVDNSYMLDKDDGYDYYSLRIRATTTSSVYGWREYIFIPKEWIVESAVFDDIEFKYLDKISLAKITIDKYNYPAVATLPNEVMNYGITQLPDGLFMIMYEFKKWGLFTYIESEFRFKYMSEIDLSFMYGYTNVNDNQYPYFSSVILPNGKIAITPATIANANSRSYILKYNTITKKIDIVNTVVTSVASLFSAGNYIDSDKIVVVDSTSIRYYDTRTNTTVALTTHGISSMFSWTVIPLGGKKFRLLSLATGTIATADDKMINFEYNDTLTAITKTDPLKYTRTVKSSTTDKRDKVIPLRNAGSISAPTNIIANIAIVGIYDKNMNLIKSNSLTLSSYHKGFNFSVLFNDGKRMYLSSGDGRSDAIIYE